MLMMIMTKLLTLVMMLKLMKVWWWEVLKVMKAWWWEVVKALNREREKLTHFRSNGGDALKVKKHQLYYIWFSLCISKVYYRVENSKEMHSKFKNTNLITFTPVLPLCRKVEKSITELLPRILKLLH